MSEGEAHDDRARLDCANGHHEKGAWVEAMREAAPLRDHPELGAEAIFLIAKCHLRLGQFAEAVMELRTARDLATASPQQRKDAAYLLGRIYEQAGNREKAIAEYERVTEIDTSIGHAPPDDE